jgi:HTH-type transcriptional regulator/antitoxin HigA
LSIPGIAYRKTGMNHESNYTLAAWSQKAKLEARKIDVKPINIDKLIKYIDTFRSFTLASPDEFCSKLQTLLASCGIALIFLPHIEGSYLSGASFLDGKKIILGLTVRGKDADKFWFRFFHELYHIIDGHINSVAITTDEEEIAADEFAKYTLINPKAFQEFVQNSNFSKTEILEFAKDNNISPGIVLGRLQKENLVRYDQYHDLKIKYVIA